MMMMKANRGGMRTRIAAGALVIAAGAAMMAGQQTATIHPQTMRRVATVDRRFQSYNIEMAQITGGRFWKPYGSHAHAAATPAQKPHGNQPAGLSASLFQYRPPVNLANARLRNLAKALGPVYLRVSGTWANTAWFQDSNAPAPSTPPAGFKSVLTRKEWKGVVDFANAVDAKLVTSFAVSPGTRNAQGVWTPKQANAIVQYTKSAGGSIAAAEYMNEPNLAAIGGAPKGYNAADFARDVHVFQHFLQKASPQTLLLGPGSSGEETGRLGKMETMSSADMLKATGPALEVFTYHFYGAISQRCAARRPTAGTTAAAALTAAWLDRDQAAYRFYSDLRNRFEPGKPIWITETADAACGGNPWAASFLDSFRYLDQHAQMAQKGVQVYMHNTLNASDYGLLDERTLTPHPNYWSAVLWNRLMGAAVLQPGASPSPALRLYAQCLPHHAGGVTLLAINTSRTAAQKLNVPVAAERYTLTAHRLMSRQVQLNGRTLSVDASGDLPAMNGVAVKAGTVTLAPESITFLAMPDAGNGACQ